MAGTMSTIMIMEYICLLTKFTTKSFVLGVHALPLLRGIKNIPKDQSWTQKRAKKVSCIVPTLMMMSRQTRALRTLQRGSWSDLQMVTGVRWAKEDRENIVGLFVWDQNVLGGLNWNRMSAPLLDKQERMVSYLFETVLGLCIAGLNNISSNPSFETFNGRFSG